MLPFLSKGPGMFLAFFRLDKDLDEPCEVSYEREGDKITPYKAIYTIRETLSQILSSIDHHVTFDTAIDQGASKENGRPCFCGTSRNSCGHLQGQARSSSQDCSTPRRSSPPSFLKHQRNEKEEVIKHALASSSKDLYQWPAHCWGQCWHADRSQSIATLRFFQKRNWRLLEPRVGREE